MPPGPASGAGPGGIASGPAQPRILDATDPATWIRYEMRHLYPALPSFVSADASAGRVALVGDAAHAMTPNLGQGACTAILDADALTRALAAAPPGPAGVAGALRAYDRERRRSAQRTAFASRTLHRFMSTERTRLRNTTVRLLPGRGPGRGVRIRGAHRAGTGAAAGAPGRGRQRLGQGSGIRRRGPEAEVAGLRQF